MRVIAGEFRSRTLVAPPGHGTRPTSDRLRETLFNVLGARVLNCRMADLFAGSGAVGLEALSRGAEHVLMVEQASPALAALRKNVQALGVATQVSLVTHPVAKALTEAERQGLSFDVIFLDPPYEASADYIATLTFLGQVGANLLRSGAIVVAEHARRHALEPNYGCLNRKRVLEQGDAALSFYAPERE